ncbi:MAG: YceI family protein [Gemmatimonadota bacterium]|jgi:polyisoprenoid-binding protein YceI
MSATTWKLDPAHTQVEFAVKHMMFTTVRGRFGDVEGSVRLDLDNPQASSVEVEIGAASIDTGVEDRDAHLRSGDFLNVEEHPHLTFMSTRVEGAPSEAGDTFKVVGDLTIRGTTREVVLDAEFEGTGADPWGGTRAGFTAKTKIDRRDFGLTWNQALETGGVLVGQEVKIELQVQAVKEEAEVEEAATAGV